jgi:hypothetical protein
MVAHEVGVLGEVDGLEGEAAEAFPPVDGLILGGGGVAATRLGAPLSVHGVGEIWLAVSRAAAPFCSILFVSAQAQPLSPTVHVKPSPAHGPYQLVLDEFGPNLA